MKFKSLIILLSMLLLVSCSNANESMTEFDTNELQIESNIPSGGIDINQTASGLGFGKILSYEAEEDGEEVHLVAQFERGTDGSENTNLYELSIVLIKNPQSCFDGYSIKTLSSQNITPIITGDNREHTFYAYDLEIEENGIFTFENYGGEDDVQYGTHIEIDLSENQTLAEFVRENTGKEFDVTYILDESMTQPVYRVVPVRITLHDEGAEPADEHEAELYETIQNMIDEVDKEFFEKPDYFGTTMYTEDKFEEIKQYEMNIVLEYLGIKRWECPPNARDEAESSPEVDAPLGEYTVEKLKEYTDEEHDLTVEYFCGGSILDNLNNRYIALIIKEYKNGNIENLYYKILDYGYLGVMTGSNSSYYKANGSLGDIDRAKIEQGDIGYYVSLWLDEDAGEVNLVYDIGKEKRTSEYGTYTSYAQSLWVILEEEGTGYRVKEMMPMRLK